MAAATPVATSAVGRRCRGQPCCRRCRPGRRACCCRKIGGMEAAVHGPPRKARGCKRLGRAGSAAPAATGQCPVAAVVGPGRLCPSVRGQGCRKTHAVILAHRVAEAGLAGCRMLAPLTPRKGPQNGFVQSAAGAAAWTHCLCFARAPQNGFVQSAAGTHACPLLPPNGAHAAPARGGLAARIGLFALSAVPRRL